jgi:hypothetical protein
MIAIVCKFFHLPSGATVWNLVVLPLKCSPVGWQTNSGAHHHADGDGAFKLAGRASAVTAIEDGIRIRGRMFTSEELSKIKMVVETSPGDHRFALSKNVCKELGWVQANGRLKDRSCRDVLQRLDEIGFIRLPRPRRAAVKRRRLEITPQSAPRRILAFGARQIEAACFRIVSGTGNAQQERLWNEYVERYHYLGYGVALGPHIKYFVTVAGEPIACLCFAGAAWRVEARDHWIGWNDEQRERNLRYVVNNTRFVVFPKIAS